MRNKRNSAKEVILNTACRLFYQQGYHSTGITQIITEAETVKATFYQHYPSKEDLGSAYLLQKEQEWLAALEQYVSRYDQPQERLMGIFEYLAQWLTENHYRGCAFLNITAEFPEAESPFRSQVKQHKLTVRAYIHQLLELMPLPDAKNKRLLADAIYILAEGAIVESQVHADTWPVDTAKQTVRLLIE